MNVSIQGHCVKGTINLGTRGSRTFVQGHIVSGRPVTPPLTLAACTYTDNCENLCNTLKCKWKVMGVSQLHGAVVSLMRTWRFVSPLCVRCVALHANGVWFGGSPAGFIVLWLHTRSPSHGSLFLRHIIHFKLCILFNLAILHHPNNVQSNTF